MKTLFLASYFSGVSSTFPSFAGDCAGKHVLFIPTASIPEKVTFYVEADKKALQKLGMLVEELEISTADRDEINGKLREAEYIFVSGGNTFFLLQELRRTGADKLISEHIERGGLYIGASAGSMILCPNIEYVKLMDDPNAAPELNGSFDALGVVGFSVLPHSGNFPFKEAAKKIVAAYGDKLDLRPIANHHAVTVRGDTVEIVTAEPRRKNAGKRAK